MAAFDYKKEYKQLYQPKKEPELIQVPPIPMRFRCCMGFLLRLR